MNFASLLQALEHVSWVTPLAAFAWGLASVALSACHLSSVPLLVTFLGRLEHQALTPSRLAAFVTLGISGSLLLVALVTFALGRILGDLWGVGPWLMAALLLLGGLNLMGAFELPSFGHLDPNKAHAGPRSAIVSGGVLGTTLGPCTFSFFAPVLALFGTNHTTGLALASVAAFSAGHLGVTLVLGFAGAELGARLGQGARWAKYVKFAVGMVAVGIALNLIVTAP